MKRFLVVVLFFSSVYLVKAQTCTQRLNQAEDDYTAGRLLGIPDRINPCLLSGEFTHEEEIRARKLLTLVYIFTDKEGLAEGAMVQLLKADPEHILDPQTDPAELFFLYEQFRVAPIFRVAFRGGANVALPQVMSEYSTSLYPKFYNGKTANGEVQIEDENGIYESTSGIGIGYWGEVLIERKLYRGLEAAIGPQFRITNYNVEYPGHKLTTKTSWTNQQIYLRSPLLLRYTFNHDNRNSKFLPYVYAGSSFDFLLSGRYTEALRDGGAPYSMKEGDSDLKQNKLVNTLNYSFFGGLGAKMRVNTDFVTFEVRFDSGQMNYINSENRYTHQPSTFDTQIAEDNLKLNVWSLSIGYTRSIYSPKKLLSR